MPIWVMVVTIWSTIVVERWKRKTSEINFRWGQLEEMNNPDILDKIVRDEFNGDERINNITGETTKF